MARNRMIKKEVLEDPKIGKLSYTAKWLFIGLWIIADDEGYLQNEPDWIKIKCFPYDSNLEINKVLKELFGFNLISQNNGVIKIKNFLKHQIINRPTESELCNLYRQNSSTTHGDVIDNSVPNIKEVNIIESNINESKYKGKRELFVKPLKTEIIDYINEKQLKVDCETFLDYYESNGWKIGKVPMKDWKATLRNWDRKTKEVKKPFKNEFLEELQKGQSI
jgi:hypothetical protein